MPREKGGIKKGHCICLSWGGPWSKGRFPATVFGGLDAIIGSGASGIFIGVFENLVGGYIAPLLKEIAGFMMILVILMVRPFGMFGQKDIERV